MKCNTPIDSETGMPLSGTALEQALKDPNSPRCGRELSPDDIFCPGCGAKVKSPSEQDSVASTDAGPATCCGKRKTHKRATRANLWGAAAAFFASNILYFIISGGDFDSSDGNLSSDVLLRILGYVNLLAYGYFIKTSVRRLHDMARSGWWMLPSVVFTLAATITTVVSAVSGSSNVFFAFCDVCALVSNLATVAWLGFAKGTQGPNKYGPDPRSVTPTLDVPSIDNGKRSGASCKNADMASDVAGHDGDCKSSSLSVAGTCPSAPPRSKTRFVWVIVLVAITIASTVVRYSTSRSGDCIKGTAKPFSQSQEFRFFKELQRKAAERERVDTLLPQVGGEINQNGAVQSAECANIEEHLKKAFQCLGEGSGQNKTEAAKLFLKAAEQGNAIAECCLGELYAEGNGVEKDVEEAVRWYRKAADKGLASAEVNLGLCYCDGQGVKEDKVEAVKWFRKAAEHTLPFISMRIALSKKSSFLEQLSMQIDKNGVASARMLLGACFEDGEGVEESIDEAIKWYRKAAELDCAEAQLKLGECYELGIGVEVDKGQAIAWYRKAAEQGNFSAKVGLERCSEANVDTESDEDDDDAEDDEDDDEAELSEEEKKAKVQRLLIAANKGDVASQVNLALCYGQGEGVLRNQEEAEKWFHRAADKGSSAAMFWLGFCSYRGMRTGQSNKRDALMWYRKAAEHGHPGAMQNLGDMYSAGDGVAQDGEEASKWYRKAAAVYLRLAESGDADAQFCLARCYRTGQGVAKDEVEAERWTRKAAAQGNAAAKLALAAQSIETSIDEASEKAESDDGLFAVEVDRVKQLRVAAERGDAQAQYELGICYRTGKGVKVNVKEADKWNRQAAENGSAEAQVMLGHLLHGSRDYAEAVKWYRKAMLQGSAAAHEMMGYCYAEGEGVEQNRKEAAEWYRKAFELYRKSAEQGNVDAQRGLACCYYAGRGVEINLKEAVRWCRAAAEQGNETAMMLLGMYSNDKGVAVERKMIVRRWRELANAGDADAQFKLGVSYEHRDGVERDFDKAVFWYRKAAEQGHVGAQESLSRCYRNGYGVEKDMDEAARWARKAAEGKAARVKQLADEEYKTGLNYRDGKGVSRDIGKAADWFEKAARHGNYDACHEIGWAYERGMGRNKDMDNAAEWYQKGVVAGNYGCCVQLGLRYLRGDCRIVKKDVDKAIELFLKAIEANSSGKWAYHGAGRAYLERARGQSDLQKAADMFRKAADIGLPDAQHYLGKCYEKGQGVSKDPKEAVKWYRKAAGQGYAVSELNLGVCYRDGWGVNKDLVKSADWFEKAANHGNMDACYEIGACYERGEGRDKNPEKAIKWYQKAAAGENETAKKALERLRKPADEPSETLSSKSSREVVEEILSMADIVRGFDQEKKRYTEIATRGFPLKHEGVDIVNKSESYDFPDQEGDDLETKRFKRVWMAYADGLAGIASSMSMSLKSFDEDVASNKTVNSIVSNARQTLDGVVTVALAESVENDKYEVTVAVAQSEKRKCAYQDYKAGKEGGASGKYSLEEWMNAKSAAGIICPQSFVDKEGVWWRVAGVPVARDRVSGNANKDCVEKARYLAALAACRTISVDVMKNSVLNIRRYADKDGEIMPHRTFEREVKITPVCSNHDTSSFKWFEIKSTSPISGDVLLVVCAIREDPGTEPNLNRQ